MVKPSLCQQPEDIRLDFRARVSGTGIRQQEAPGQILWAELWGVLGCSTTTVTLSWCHSQPWQRDHQSSGMASG